MFLRTQGTNSLPSRISLALYDYRLWYENEEISSTPSSMTTSSPFSSSMLAFESPFKGEFSSIGCDTVQGRPRRGGENDKSRVRPACLLISKSHSQNSYLSHP